ncbi:type I polyketide synthase [Burkholderia oklahomensis]|uniref:type I polyketide synthase n=5 Tax=Burkholderia oklahomensis TaxID=342113 RepID=UPI0005D99C7B|nr:type I polyketide synthase [Burkholderia oklahomensis]AJX33431.1 zinc-binding dehydrogenase family protein [Burkholderia oklahomensis C6786]AOI45006.1 beta-ketoacyl synthase [Burkholderia oklahomensis C6786]KUY65470.1 beta-ketoacyl synthase [Burkholderia oklahomensis C6786]MBI0358954.1 type I polyketide synthase [Burkholderia oklahomensis]SUW57554.1 Erythronolide synthase, modules 3 and 4 [Burkholderia oklahomensis]
MNVKIAIVGMACRFPGGVESPDAFWRLLCDERDAVTEVPAERFGTDFYRHPSKREPGKSYTFAAGVLDNVAGFDAAFFGISPREATQMDPQQRLLLELAWEAFEDAGVRPADMRGRNCGVYVGVASPDYGNRSMDDLNSVDPYSATGNTLSIASNRVSYLFDLRGPSMSVDTACSSSLVALHQAIQALQSGDAELALAGGVNLLAHPFGFVSFSKASMLSPRGRCRAFDATGDGYVRAEGGAFVLLKPLERALADGDTIHAVIAGSGVNSDGYSPGGISVPGAATQAALLRDVYGRAGIDPRSLVYLEAHGTGTAVGDPIEARALIEVAGAQRPEHDPLLIGSVKTNIGHLETASGMAGLFKAVCCLEHRAVPRSLHFETPNPNIDFAGGRLRVVDRYTPLDEREAPLTIGVNSFGFGGTNAHVVLMEAPAAAADGGRGDATEQNAPDADAVPPPLVLTARAPRALAALAARYLQRLDDGCAWHALAANVVRRRQWFEARAVVAPANVADGRAALAALAQPGGASVPACVAHAHAAEHDARVALLFSGNGSQWAGMGRELYAEDAVFRAALAEVDALWCADGSASLVDVMCAGASAEWLAATENAQPLLFAIQVGIVRVLDAHGVRFDAVAGHSVGEIAAAWAADALSLADAVRVIKIRSRAQALTRGSGRMAAAGVGEDAARALIAQLPLASSVEIAGVNSPQSVTLAGPLDGLQAIEASLRATGQFFQLLDLDYAFHSKQMERIEPVVLEKLAGVAPRAGTGGFVSTVTGGRFPGDALDARYWWRNIREPVRFGDAIAHLAADGIRLFIEVSPHSILRTYVKQTLTALKLSGTMLPTLKRQQDGAQMLRQAIASAVAHGARIDPDRFAPDSPRVALPTYPWQRERYWLDPSPEGYGLVNRRRAHPLLGYRLREHAFAWENQLDPVRVPMLADHVVDGGVTFPGAGYVEMALAAACAFFGTSDCALENLEIRAPVVFQGQQAKLFRFTIEPRTASFKIETRDRMCDAPWVENVVGRLLESGNTLNASSAVSPEALARLFAQPASSADALYDGAAALGLAYGPAFRWVRALRIAGDAALAELAAPQACGDAAELAAYLLHPALMDSGFHPLFALLAQSDGRDACAPHAAYVPVRLGRIDFLRGDVVARVLARIERRNPHSIVASFEFLDASGAIVARLAACRFRRVDLVGRRLNAPARFAYALDAKPLPSSFDASALPAPGRLVESAIAMLAAGEDLARRTSHLTEMLPLFDVLASAYALRALDAIDAFRQPVPPADERAGLVARLAAMLVEDGLAQWAGTRLVRNDTTCAAMPALDELWRGLLAESPAHVAELTLLAHCGALLPAVLRGETAPAQALSPTGGSLVDHFYEASPTWGHAHALIAACVEQALAAWRAPRRLRVLEIGAPGRDVLRPLGVAPSAARCDYTIAGTPQQLAGFDAAAHPSMQTVALQTGEGVAIATDDRTPYDIVLIDRALAAQHDPLAFLSVVFERLAPGGLVVLAETRGSRFADIVFALAASGASASQAAALAPAEIQSLLSHAGFRDVARHLEQSLDLEGAPTFVVARKPAAKAGDAREALDGGVWDSLDTAAYAERWLVATGDDGDAGAALAGALASAGCYAEAVSLNRMAEIVAVASPAQPHHLVFVAPDAALAADADGAAMMRAQRTGVVALARLVRELGVVDATASVRLSVVTRGGAPFALDAPLDPTQAGLWGLGRVLANEHSELSCRLIDVHPGCGAALDVLVRELLADDAEEEVLLTPRGRFVPRMLSAAQIDARAPGAIGERPPAVLAFDAPGSLRNLEWFALRPHELELAPDEVEIEPVATGLNFRDVMYAMGLLSDEAVEAGFAGATIGMELAGRVVRAGRDVDGFAAGDAVLGFAPASFATRVRTRAAAVAHKPSRLSFEEAATIPTTFFTAYYALAELARLRRGERVLVHGAAGGVGIAAIQLARRCGAEVFATAGSDEKREFVRLIGADHVLDSRSLSFADEIRALTGGEGVDVVLNSLAGEAMVRSIDTLRPFGRFLELGKRDFYENSHIGLRPFRNNISYFGIDADQLMGARPDLTERLFGDVIALFAEGALHPLPYRAFPAARVEDAFRYMQQARQIGKVLVTYPAGTPAPTRGMASTHARALRLDPHAAYLVVGGTGGLGFASARWMVSRGARHLTLASRGGALAEPLRDEVERWRDELGVQTHVVACDATDAAALARAIGEIDARGAPLKGVLHSAMHIDDGLVRNLDDERFAAVLAPKVAGAWNLHRATRGRTLDFFVVYSSATTYLGNPGQASYVAANSFVEALVEQRRAAGLAGTAMAWGPLEDVGFLARHAETREALQARIGGVSITSGEALAALERVLLAGGAGEAVVRLDWHAVSRGMPAAGARRYALLRARGASEPARDGGTRLRAQVAALSRDEAVGVVEDNLRAQIACILHLSTERIELDKSVLEMGMDSLMGMELGMAVEETFEVKLSVMSIADGATVHSLAGRIVDMISGAAAGPSGPGEGDDAQVAAIAAQHALDGDARTVLKVGDDEPADAAAGTPKTLVTA